MYSDFHLQRYTNPDGFAANVTAWEEVLQKATWAGLIPSDTNGADILSLTVGEKLLQLLETKEWGRPLSLAIVIVCKELPLALFVGQTLTLLMAGRGCIETFHDSDVGVP